MFACLTLKSNQLYTYLYILVLFYSKENSISGWLNGEREEVNSGRLRHWKTSIFMSSWNLWLHSAVSRLCRLFIIYFILKTIFCLVWGGKCKWLKISSVHWEYKPFTRFWWSYSWITGSYNHENCPSHIMHTIYPMPCRVDKFNQPLEYHAVFFKQPFPSFFTPHCTRLNFYQKMCWRVVLSLSPTQSILIPVLVQIKYQNRPWGNCTLKS